MTTIKQNNQNNKESAIVVGGSLSGLMTAIALAEQKIHVTVLEKSKEGVRSGAGLQVEGNSYNQTKIEAKLKQLVSDGESKVTLWSSIESSLRKKAHKINNIDLNFNTRVVSIHQDQQSAWAKTKEGKIYKADILIGADGHRSIVRDKVAPDNPNADFAGYVVWMASIAENKIPQDKRPKAHEQEVQMFNTPGGFMFGSVIEDENNIRRIGCTWYDNTKTDLLKRLGAIEGRVVHHSIDGKDLEKTDLDKLAKEAKTKWPEPWRTATLHAIESRSLIGIPIKEYVPTTLINNRLAIIGDAAHVPAPITASGFNESLKDAVVLSECVANGISGSKASEALKEYEKRRLKVVQRMVKSGQYFTKSFGRFE